MAIQKKDFIELEYTGRLKDSGMIFDTTDEKTAKDNEIFNEKGKYGPVTVCVGEQHVIKGLDHDLEGKEMGEFEVVLQPEDAFGKKDAKLVQLISTAKFKKQGIQPQPGLQVNIDGYMGLVKTVSGGRTLVDFNHPLSGQEVVYKYKIIKKVEDKKEKIKALVNMMVQLDAEVSEKEGKFTVKMPENVPLPEEAKKIMQDKIKELVDAEAEIVKEDKKEKTEAKPAKEAKKEPTEESTKSS